MAVYLIAFVEVTDDSWLPDYAGNVHDIVHKHGGKYLSRSANITTVEGEGTPANMIALLEFPSREAVDTFANDPDYAPHGGGERQHVPRDRRYGRRWDDTLPDRGVAEVVRRAPSRLTSN